MNARFLTVAIASALASFSIAAAAVTAPTPWQSRTEIEKPEKPQKPEKVGAADFGALLAKRGVERAERPEKPQKPEKVGVVDPAVLLAKAEVEKPEKPQKPEKVG